MRLLPVLCVVATLSACISSTMDEPRIRLSPYLAVYQLRGNLGLQSPGANPGDPPVSQPRQDMRAFGQDHHREDVGGRLDIGDGFGGLRLDYYRLDMGSKRPGVVEAPWGNLARGDQAILQATMDDLRIGWVEPLLARDFEYRDRPVKVQFGAGAVFAHREMAFKVRNETYTASQNLDMSGDILFGVARARVGYREFAVDFDWAVSPDLALSGEFGDLQQDVEAWLSYQPQRDIRLFAGYRYSQMAISGTSGELRFDSDLVLDGYQFGVTISF